MSQLDLASPELFQDWFSIQKATNDSLSILESIKGDDDLARCRRMCVAYWTLLRPAKRRLALIKDCLFASDYRVQSYAVALMAFWRLIDEYPTLGTKNYLESNDFIPMLKARACVLQQDSTAFAKEAMVVTQLSLASFYLLAECFDEALSIASEGLFWAKELGAGVLVAQLQSVLLSVQLANANLEEVLRVASATNMGFLPEVDALYQQVFCGVALSQLGAWRRAGSLLLGLTKAHPLNHDPKKWRDVELCIHAEKQYLDLFCGVGGLQGEVIKDHHPNEWLAQAYRELLRAQAIPKLNARQLKLRNKHFRSAARIAQQDYSAAPDLRNELNAVWLCAYASLRQGKTALVVAALSACPTVKKGWLDLRILLAGLKLELALSLQQPLLSPLVFEQEIKLVLKEAVTIEPASRSGLADLLMRWHPLAAAYLALVPDSPAEFKRASRAVLSVGRSNGVYDILLAPAFACELILRSFELDLSLARFEPSDPGASRKKKLELLVQQGELDYWRPCFSVMLIVYGFKKLALPAYDAQADLLLKTFGVMPVTKSSYSLVPLLERIAGLVDLLVSNDLSPKGFADSVLDL